MADLLAAVDDLAQDIRDELDRTIAQSVDSEFSGAEHDGTGQHVPQAEEEGGDQSPVGQEPTSIAEILATLRQIVEGLERPTALASVAYELQKVYGPDVTKSWAGYGTFKSLLTAAAPDVAISLVGPGYVFPEGTTKALITTTPGAVPPGDQTLEEVDSKIPPIVVRLRSVDRWVPCLPPDRLRELYTGIVLVLAHETWDELGFTNGSPGSIGLAQINELTRLARDRLAIEGITLNRHHLDYVLKALLWSGNLRAGLPPDQAVEIVRQWIYNRAVAMGLSSDPPTDLDSLTDWLDAARA
ncbi:MAG TPA: hypothetical protein VNQ33_01060 [Acidimicrobiales bacterium]|nr:hypothetical protein [Acidimicrobiales bacterium]